MAPDPARAENRPSDAPRICVYTAIFGQYDALLDQPVSARSDARFICFTDDPELTSDSWEVRLVEPRFAADPVRSARLHKILGPQADVPFDVSVYIDASVRLRETPEVLVAEWLPDGVDLALPLHSYRDHLIDEFDEVIRLNYDDRARVYEQLADYAERSPDVLSARPHWTAILLRRRTDAVSRAMRVWADHVLRYSRRDQLSVMVALDDTVNYRGIDIDNFSSRFHEWPVTDKRRIAQGKAPYVPAGPILAELQRARRRVSELEGEVHALQPDRLREFEETVASLKLQIEQGYQERVRLEQRLDAKTREAVLASERVRHLEAHEGRVSRLARRFGVRSVDG
ncbi:DUF616 domain-containing protein [Microbacterium sp. ACRRU]|uniref:glycosyltransferase domain-containing protein n=1 Tax=Microbacterium sp. ACRRU TaxID=2918204 RepID=UPI001EF4B22A|nr:glycosyltransferase domain-containing protein [Microbacterium sp. ACRRU]MCG7418118.1 DUF616 domain-containing protein [Microbacterium sp. ACRRU]